MSEQERIVLPFRQEQPADLEQFMLNLLGCRVMDAEHGLIECGCIIVDAEANGQVTETHWFKVLQ